MGESVQKQVLRYWLACVRMEEALATRPRARRTPMRAGPVHIEMAQPVEGAEYVRLPVDGEMWRVAAGQDSLSMPVDAAVAAFFETWLSRQYRGGPSARVKRTRGSAKRKEADDRVKHLLCFPVVHLPRQELAGLLRCDVQLDFLQPDGAMFVPPDAKSRRAKQFPPAPSEMRVCGAGDSPEARLPFFVDTRLLHEQLGAEPGEIDAFFESLRSAQTEDEPVTHLAMLTALCELLAPDTERKDTRTDSTPEVLEVPDVLERLVARMNERLSERPNNGKAYGFAIIVDAQQARSTWHLQRELSLLIEEKAPTEADPTTARPALDAYLSGAPPEIGRALQRAAYPGSPLTPSQRRAAESALGSPLSAVQGPPGTGKTTVILHLAAEHIVQQVDSLVDGGKMGRQLMVVASTNNRAVDNVIEPLNVDPALGASALPLSLRTGSREVCDKITSRQIRDAMTWLSRYTEQTERQTASAGEALEQAKAAYREIRTSLLHGEADRSLDLQRRTRRRQLEKELAQLDLRLAPGDVDSAAGNRMLPQDFTRADLNLVSRAPEALEKVARLAEASASPKAIERLGRAYARFQKELGAELQVLHARTQGSTSEPWPLPPKTEAPSPEGVMEAWEDAVEQCNGTVAALAERIASALEERELHLERARLAATLAEDAAALADTPEDAFDGDAAKLDPARVHLFEAALAVRQAWAIVNAAPLHEALEIACRCTAGERSMRTLFRAEDDAGRWLRQLFSVWGCTLLSMANAVPAESKALHRVVIDEAGQCHPAHAVSVLMRCRSALIIGDVHQLEPVIGLGRQDEGRVQAQAQIRLHGDALGPYRVHSEGRNSVQSLADRALGGSLQLVDHFRCQAAIIALCDALCDYGLRVHTPASSRSSQAPFLCAPLLFKEVAGEQERLGGSWVNRAELEECMLLLESMLRAGIGSNEIAIITPYRGQLELLQRAAAQRGIQLDRGLRTEDPLSLFGGAGTEQGLTLGTVHRFQGGERSVVLFSSVITQSASLGFLNQRVNLLNVTISRAREHLVTLGHAETLAAGRHTRCLVTGASVAAVR